MRGLTPSKPRRRLVAASVAVALLLAVPLGAVAEDALKEAREELQQTKERIRARAAKMRTIQHEINRIATRIARTEAEIHDADESQARLSEDIAVLVIRHALLQQRLDQRTAEAYILGPGLPILYLLTATSASDAVNRIGFLDEMNRRDGELATKVGRAEARLAVSRAGLELVEGALALAQRHLAQDHA